MRVFYEEEGALVPYEGSCEAVDNSRGIRVHLDGFPKREWVSAIPRPTQGIPDTPDAQDTRNTRDIPGGAWHLVSHGRRLSQGFLHWFGR